MGKQACVAGTPDRGNRALASIAQEKNMRNYIGLSNSFHDPALAIVDSKGVVVFAEGAERYLQNKRALGAPPDDAIRIESLLSRYCEPGADIVFAKSWERSRAEAAYKGARGLFRNITEGTTWGVNSLNRPFLARLGFDVDRLDTDAARYLASVYQWLTEMSFDSQREIASSSLRFRLRDKSQPYSETAAERIYDHHLSHAATACWSSPFEEAVCAVIDGYGEAFQANSFYRFIKGRIEPIPGPDNAYGSLGHFYALLCVLCGFDWVKGEEWKVMGLAGYGQFNWQVHDVMFPMLEHCKLGFRPAPDFANRIGELLKLRRLGSGDPRKVADVAYTGQQVFCKWSRMLLEDLYSLGLSKNLILTGGCALNSAWNGQILEQIAFDGLHIPSAPADDGNAIGAALLAYQEDHPASEGLHIPSAPAEENGIGAAVLADCPEQSPSRSLQTPFLGESISQETLKRALAMGGLTNALPPGRSAPEYAAELLAQGMIVGWVQGRAEFGPRALGNRSILADPRDPAMKDRINARVKFREEYRPFAPSILHEHGEAYFENYQQSPYMERTLCFRPEVKEIVPAVVHEDGTGRLQSVCPEWNKSFYDLIAAFHGLTGVPLVLNTSFNIMGKPIIHSVEDAIAVFFTTGLDALVIEDVVIEKPHAIAARGAEAKLASALLG
jgi:carbamoyltransferase